MAEAQAAASFNPDDASGLLDNARVKIAKVVVDFFTAKSGEKFVNVDVTYKGDAEITEHYMLGGADKWAPNASKTGAISLTEGGKIWNKSDVFKLMKSLVDAGFPKAKLGSDLSTLVGLDVHVSRVTQEGSTYTDAKTGQERNRSTLLVTKIYEAAAGGKAATKTAAKTTAAAATTAAPVESTEANDEYLIELLTGTLLAKGPVDRSKLGQPLFIALTRAKKVDLRPALDARLKDDTFLAGLAEAGLITIDGNSVALAA